MRRVGTGVVLLGISLMVGCGSGSDAATGSTASSGGAALTPVTVANLAVTNSAALVLGVQKGFFKEQGLEVTLKDTAAASTQPAVVSGQAQFAFTNVPAVLAATSNGLPVRVVAPAAAYPKPGDPASVEVVAKAGSGITKPADLAGKKIAVDTLYQLPHLSLIQAAKAAGVDPSTFKIVEVPYPAMGEAVERGQVDAADMAEPFLGQAVAKGYVEVLANNEGVAQGVVQAVWVTSASYLAKNDAVVQKFKAAVAASNTYASANPDEVRAIMPSYLKVTPEQATKARLPDYSAVLDQGPFASYLTLMKEVGVVKKDVDLNTIIVK